MATLTLDQKRLAQIRTQLYGKQSDSKPSKKATILPNHKTVNESEKLPTTHHQDSTDYIRNDVTKVAVLTTIIILLQLTIYVALTNKWLTINFYGITY